MSKFLFGIIFVMILITENFSFAKGQVKLDSSNIYLNSYYLKEAGSNERIPAWTITLKIADTCEWTIKKGKEKSKPSQATFAECADLKKLRDALQADFTKPAPVESATDGSTSAMLHYEIEFQNAKRPVFFQAPRRCKIDSEGNEINCVDFKLSNAQKFLNIMRPKVARSSSYH